MLNYQEVGTGNCNPVAYGARFVAATLLVGGGVTEASAKSRHHRHHHHHHATMRNAQGAPTAPGATPMPRSAVVGAGRSFSGMASFYGNESGSKTASGQRFNQNAMTAPTARCRSAPSCG